MLQRTKHFFFVNNAGSALPLVLFFSAIGLIVIFTYISQQLLIAKPSLSSQTSTQALFNARSGIYKAFDIITNGSTIDTLATIEANSWGEDLLKPDSQESDDEFDETPKELNLFANDSFGNCEITLVPYGSFYELKSVGIFGTCKRTVTTHLGGKIPALPDTVCILMNALPWEGSEPRGTVVNNPVQDSTSNSKSLEKLLSDYTEALQAFDTLLPQQPLNIFGSRDLSKIRDTINGDCTFDGRTSKYSWNEQRTLYINGKLTIIGDVKIQNVSFVVADDIIFSEGASIKNASVYTSRGLFIENNSSFSGDAIALRSIAVYDEATILNKSSLVVAGTTTSSSTSSDSTTPGGSSDPEGTTTSKSKKDSLKYAIYIENRAVVDGVCIALGTPGSVKTGPETKVTGIIWAKNQVCHQGLMEGCIKAGRMIDCSVPDVSNLPTISAGERQPTAQLSGSNGMTGSIKPLESITQYKVPCFTDDLAIIEWIEE